MAALLVRRAAAQRRVAERDAAAVPSGGPARRVAGARAQADGADLRDRTAGGARATADGAAATIDVLPSR